MNYSKSTVFPWRQNIFFFCSKLWCILQWTKNGYNVKYITKQFGMNMHNDRKPVGKHSQLKHFIPSPLDRWSWWGKRFMQKSHIQCRSWLWSLRWDEWVTSCYQSLKNLIIFLFYYYFIFLWFYRNAKLSWGDLD